MGAAQSRQEAGLRPGAQLVHVVLQVSGVAGARRPHAARARHSGCRSLPARMPGRIHAGVQAALERTMAPYTVHHAPLTRSVRAVWALRELGLEHEVVERPLIDFVMDKS